MLKAANVSFGEGAMMVLAAIAAGAGIIGLLCAVGALWVLPREGRSFGKGVAWLGAFVNGAAVMYGGFFVALLFVFA